MCAVLLLLSVSCNNYTSETYALANGFVPAEYEETGIPFSRNIVFEIDTLFQSVTDTVELSFTVQKNHSYSIMTNQNEMKLFPHISIKFPNEQFTQRSVYDFTAQSNGTCLLRVAIAGVSPTVSYPTKLIFAIAEVEPVPTSIIGKWLLIKAQTRAFSTLIEHNYSSDSVYQLIQISDSSIVKHVYGSKIYERSLANTEISRIHYSLNQDTLILSHGNPFGSVKEYYIQYDYTIEDVQWENSKYKVPEEFLGTWYMFEDEGFQVRLEPKNKLDTVLHQGHTKDKYPTIKQSTLIYEITEDSLIRYSRYGSTVTQYTEIPTTVINLCKMMKRNGSTLTLTDIENVSQSYYGTYSYVYEDRKTFSEYKGPLPPLEWN